MNISFSTLSCGFVNDLTGALLPVRVMPVPLLSLLRCTVMRNSFTELCRCDGASIIPLVHCPQLSCCAGCQHRSTTKTACSVASFLERSLAMLNKNVLKN